MQTCTELQVVVGTKAIHGLMSLKEFLATGNGFPF